MGTSGAVDRT